MKTHRRLFALSALALSFGLMLGTAHAQEKIRIGWALSKTGPNAGGTATTQTPNTDVGTALPDLQAALRRQ